RERLAAYRSILSLAAAGRRIR
ncbi:MAG: hypothetical protein QOH66_1819, partial [Actinomycetota bacterium]|nr:hypothetical protein [Actinomycetota bacterium]